MNEPNASADEHHEMLRIDLQESLHHSTLDPNRLSAFQRILLTTDGTVTEILEAQFFEAICIVKLDQDVHQSTAPIASLDLLASVPIMSRKVLLQGEQTGKNYIYAESILVPDRLEATVREDLLSTRKPIGQLMIETRMETYREILACRLEPTGEIGKHFCCPGDAKMICRTYRVFANQRPIMLITEKFPDTDFTD